jgi:hypothetical protein
MNELQTRALVHLTSAPLPPPPINNNSSTNVPVSGRKTRPDIVFHYPFTDDRHSVHDILTAPADACKPHLLSMGAPARTRFVAKVFEEMRLNQKGIRLSDLPEALDVCFLLYLLIPSVSFFLSFCVVSAVGH